MKPSEYGKKRLVHLGVLGWIDTLSSLWYCKTIHLFHSFVLILFLLANIHSFSGLFSTASSYSLTDLLVGPSWISRRTKLVLDHEFD